MIVSYDEQIYLLGFYLRSNIIPIGEELAKETPSHSLLLELVRDYLVSEFSIEDAYKIAEEIIEAWDIA